MLLLAGFGEQPNEEDRDAMNILLVTPWRPSLTGGISTVVNQLRSEFCKKGHDVTVLVGNGRNILNKEKNADGKLVYEVYLRSPVSNERPIRAIVMCWIAYPFTIAQLLWLSWYRKVNAIIIQYPLPGMFYFALLKNICGLTLIVVYQGNDAHDLSKWDRRERKLINSLLQRADAVVAVSGNLLKKVREACPGLKFRREQLLPNGAPIDLVDQAEIELMKAHVPTDFAFTACHLIHRKGVDVLIEAIKIAKDWGTNIQLVIAGDGPEKENLLQLARTNNLAQQIKFIGDQSHLQILSLMKSCLFFVLSSRAEGMPLVIVEAMACGKSVVATDVDGVPEIVQNGVTGILVPADDCQLLAKGMVRLYSDSNYRKSLENKAKARAIREYSWESIADRYLELIEACKETNMRKLI
jgi:glycosyltransferase involved in cell wall biosynthesis